MNILSQFPTLLEYSIYVPVLLRFVLAYYLITHAIKLIQKNDMSVTLNVLMEIFNDSTSNAFRLVIAGLRFITALLLILGLFTQSAALVAVIIYILRRGTKSYIKEEATVDFLLIAIALSILFLGPGLFSIDLPL